MIRQSGGLLLRRAAKVKGHESGSVKRVLLEFCKSAGTSIDEAMIPTLVLELSPGVPTPEHRALCGDFYLKY